jgi:hypothetical protein
VKQTISPRARNATSATKDERQTKGTRRMVHKPNRQSRQIRRSRSVRSVSIETCVRLHLEMDYQRSILSLLLDSAHNSSVYPFALVW